MLSHLFNECLHTHTHVHTHMKAQATVDVASSSVSLCQNLASPHLLLIIAKSMFILIALRVPQCDN